MQPNHAPYRFFLVIVSLMTMLAFSGCANLLNRDSMRVSVAGIEPLEGQGLEMRFAVKLRVQNPNDTAVNFDGVALDLDVNGRSFASGVSPQSGTVPRFGEILLSVPVTVSAVSVARQALGYATGDAMSRVSYVARGKLSGGVFGGARFTDSGTIDFPTGNGAFGY